MAVDIGISNALINAYLAGQEIASKRNQAKVQQEQFSEEQKFKQQQEADRVKAQEAELESHRKDFEANYALNKAAHDIALLKMKQELGQQVSEEGPSAISAMGGKLEGSQFDETGQYPTTISFSHPLLGDVTVEHPLARSQRIAQQKETEEAPKRETQRQLQEAETKRQVTVEELKQVAADIKEQRDYKKAIDLANLNGHWRTLAAEIAASKPNATQTQKSIDKLTELVDIRNTAQQAKDLLDKVGWNNYFKGGGFGIVGGITEATTNLRGGVGDQDQDRIRTLLGKIADKQKKLLEGSVLSKSEEPYLTSHTPSFQRNQHPVAAQEKIDNFLADQDFLIKANQEVQRIRPNTNPNTPPTKPKNRVKVDAQGNEIK